MFTRPVWAEISRRNLVENYLYLRALAGSEADLLAVVKANAYGHGMAECSPLLVAEGAEWLGVTSVEEGVRLRTVCPNPRVLVMSGIWHREAEALIEHVLTPVVWEQFHFELLEAAAARLGLVPGSIPVHLEIDTGMSRQGVRCTPAGENAGLEALLARINSESPLRLEALMTHFSAPEALDAPTTAEQITGLEAALAAVVRHGLRPSWISVGNSATILAGNQTGQLQRIASGVGARLLLRPGLSLYGYAPRFSGGAVADDELRPVLSWKTHITSLRTIKAGEGVGYNSTFRANRSTQLALLPCGYADGISRLLSNRGSVLIRGRRAPIAGRISMDQTIVDVTGLGAEIGDEVVLIGTQGETSITAYDIADLIGTIPYEVLCGINLRVPRIVID